MQAPINPKDWSFLPTTILSVAFLVGIGVWAVDKLGLTKKESKSTFVKEPASGELKPEVWHKRFDDIERNIDKSREEQVDAMRDLTRAINDLTTTIIRGK